MERMTRAATMLANIGRAWDAGKAEAAMVRGWDFGIATLIGNMVSDCEEPIDLDSLMVVAVADARRRMASPEAHVQVLEIVGDAFWVSVCWKGEAIPDEGWPALLESWPQE